MTVRIPHSLDAVIQAVEALIDGRAMPEEWSQDPEPAQSAAPVPDPVPEQGPVEPHPVFDEGLLAQAIGDLIDKKMSDIPQSNDVDLGPISDRLQTLETAFASLPPGFPEAVLLTLDIQKSQTVSNEGLETRVAALENIMIRLSGAIHKEGVAA